jgi:hypothetical protein
VIETCPLGRLRVLARHVVVKPRFHRGKPKWRGLKGEKR